ncbi:MAG: hypothetical protein WCO56_27265 [Verrucomicrobiota bacterium]
MSFDPTKPENNSLIRAAELRAQFNGIKAELDELRAQIAALPAEPPGPKGDKGDPGEVTAAQLAEALSNLSAALIANSSANSNGVMPMDFAVSDPPTQWELGTIFNTINALILALRRSA